MNSHLKNNNETQPVLEPGFQDEENRVLNDLRASYRFLEIANRHVKMVPLLNECVSEIQKMTGIQAVGMRILDDNGFIPYKADAGFSEKFFEEENLLSIKCDRCFCINVIEGITDPNLSLYTTKGSFLTNNNSDITSSFTEAEIGPIRNTCIRFGYESMALIPIRLGNKIIGLIQLADSSENKIPPQTIESLEWIAQQLAISIQRINAEEALRDRDQQLKQLGDNLPEGMIYQLVHKTDGSRSFTYATKGAERIFQITPEEITKDANVLYSLLSPEEIDRVAKLEAKSLESLDVFNFEAPLKLPNGETRWFHWHSKPKKLADGNFVWDGVCLDITLRKQAEKALRNAHDSLENQVQERTKDLVISNRDLKIEIENRKQAEFDLRDAFDEIKQLKNQLEADRTYLQEEIKLTHNHENIIGESDTLKYVLLRAEQVALTDTTVLILGETGTGKELIARTIHNSSKRKERPLIMVNCAALPANLIESELFGHVKGAFTGAVETRIGRFELANGATIFLDEIGELPLELQSKLLRVLQDGQFERLGSSKTLHTDVRVIAATNRDLEEDISNKLFRMDLWYRLNVFAISLPPLRERIEDIGLLVNYFIKIIGRKLGKQIKSVPTTLLTKLQNYSWPGNIRELENVMERAIINTTGDTLQFEDSLGGQLPAKDTGSPDSPIISLEESEREHILYALNKAGWKIHGEDGAANLLGINPSTLRGRMRKHGIERPTFKN